MRNILCVTLIALLGGCTSTSVTEKYQDKRNDIINVKDKVIEFETGNVLIGSVSRLYMSNKCLLIADHKSVDKQIHIFNKNDFSYLTSIGNFGEGPEEITVMGCLAIDEAHHQLYVSDHAKQKIFSYDMDSVMVDSLYKPQVKTAMNETLFPSEYQYINDTLSIAVLIKPTSTSTFNQFLGRWNMNTGEMIPMKYTHPDIQKKRITFAASEKAGIYVECYTRHDLMTICSLDGELLYNIYGPDWDGGNGNKLQSFGTVMIGNDKIFVSYCGEDYARDSFPTKILVFDLEGNYLKTLDTGYKISHCCYDSFNNRIILSLNDVVQFAYLDIDGII